MRRKRKFHRLHARRQKKGGGTFRWLLVLSMIGVIVWFWWQHEQPRKKTFPPTAARASATNADNPIPVPPTASPRPVPPKPEPKPTVVTPPAAASFPRPVRNGLEAQTALARRVISAGVIDGTIGSQTRLAISVFQRLNHLPETGQLDTNTRPLLTLDTPVSTTYTVTSNDLARLQPLGKTWLAKSLQTALDYETLLELIAEKSHAHPELIRRLNPGVVWTNVAVGATLQIVEANYPAPTGTAAFVVIHLSEKYLEVFDAGTNLLAHFPCSIAARVEKRPVGELRMTAVAPEPNYTFDPAVFPESPEAQALGRKLILPPGPNNPVGVAWISLDRPGYGIHGTPIPEQVGRTESHGCFRLANWDAEYLIKLARVGLPVLVLP